MEGSGDRMSTVVPKLLEGKRPFGSERLLPDMHGFRGRRQGDVIPSYSIGEDWIVFDCVPLYTLMQHKEEPEGQPPAGLRRDRIASIL